MKNFASANVEQFFILKAEAGCKYLQLKSFSSKWIKRTFTINIAS